MIFIVSIDSKFSPLQVEKLRHEILNLRGVVSAEWQEAAQQSVEPTAPRIKAGNDFSYMLSQQIKKD